ncbi:MAG: hypothetical protein U1E66_11560 [Rhodospirillales bacterium]
MLTHSPYDAESSSTTGDRKSSPSPLPFESEFDGVRREISPPKEPMMDPSRYWDLHGGTD